jgi:hypothetical protein
MATAGSTLSSSTELRARRHLAMHLRTGNAVRASRSEGCCSAGVRTRSEWLAASTADRLTNQHRPSLPLVPMAGPKDGSQ